MPTFFTPTDRLFSLPPGGSQTVVREFFLADVNADGRLDAVLTYQAYPVENRPVAARVLTGDGAGGFSDGSAQAFPGGAPQMVGARHHVLADFNGDGRQDLFLADTGLDAAPYPGAPNALYFGAGAGFTATTGALPAFSDYTPTASGADIDRDGDVDLFVGDLGQRGPYFLINNGAGAFTVDQTRLPAEVANPANGRFSTALLFDANGDGAADLFVGGDGASRILLNDGTGRFSIPGGMSYPFTVDHQVVDASAADLNADGRLDLVVSVALDNFSRGAVQVLMNQGGGLFVDETAQRVAGGTGVVSDPGAATWIYRAPLADVNGDGAPDIMLAGGAGSLGGSAILLNDGTGRFTPMPGLLPGLSPLDRLSVGDINGDGRMDILVRRADDDAGERITAYLGADAGPAFAGGAGVDGLMGDGSADTVHGLAGDDVIFGGGGEDYLRGDEGNDRIAGGPAFDDTHGNMGDDTVSGGFGDDWVVGGKDQDLLYGDDGGDVVYGNLGNDTCEGGAGDDVVRGGQGDDILRGGIGGDWLSGDRGSDTVTGGLGADVFNSFGEAGLDRVVDFNLAEGDRVRLDAGSTYSVAQVGADTVVSVGAGGQLVLAGVQMATLAEGWIFVG